MKYLITTIAAVVLVGCGDANFRGFDTTDFSDRPSETRPVTDAVGRKIVAVRDFEELLAEVNPAEYSTACQQFRIRARRIAGGRKWGYGNRFAGDPTGPE